jgi:hypothetical protein
MPYHMPCTDAKRLNSFVRMPGALRVTEQARLYACRIYLARLQLSRVANAVLLPLLLLHAGSWP